jgi:hypothetical protein
MQWPMERDPGRYSKMIPHLEEVVNGNKPLRAYISPTGPGLEICKIARRTKADLILVGCHDNPGKQSISRLDYVGMTIFEKAPCPAMLVPP